MELTYDSFISRLFVKATQTGTPLSGTFELTSRCTLDCKMCYIHKKEYDAEIKAKEKPTKWWLDLAKKAQESGMLLLLLTGGEPMLREDFDEIYLACKRMGLLVTINTNATLIDEKKIQLFKENPPQRVNITLYGTSKETYGNLCGVPQAYDKVIWAIKSLKEAGIRLKINYTITPYNKDDVIGASDFAKELGVPIQTVSYMFPPVRACKDCGENRTVGYGLAHTAERGRGEQYSQEMYSAEQASLFPTINGGKDKTPVGYGLAHTAEKCGSCGKNKTLAQTQNSEFRISNSEFATRLSPEDASKATFNLQKHRLGDDFINFLKYNQKENPQTDYFDDCEKEGERIRCKAGSTMFWVTWDGKMTPCGMMVEPVALVDAGFENAWQKIRKEREAIILPPECTNCEYRHHCDICAAVSYAETGRFDVLPTYVCEKAKAYAKLVEQAL